MKLEKLLNKKFPQLEHTLNARDAMLYSLGIGYGENAVDPKELQFIYEAGLQVFPGMVNVISHPGGWVKEAELEIDWVKLLHGEQAFELYRPLEPNKTYVGTYRITGVIDKGIGKGVMIYMEKQLREKGHDEIVSTVTSTYVLRGDGGCGSTIDKAPAVHQLPDRPHDIKLALATIPQAALIYRLSGDYNPIHADPILAQQAGFEKPILHGLCTLGIATRAVLQTCCENKPERLKSLQLRFSSPVYPGETIITEIWRDNKNISFRSKVIERDVIVLNNGLAKVS